MAEHYIIDGKEHVYESADEKHHIKKNITLNGTYKAESEPGDVTGYSEVNVNVEGGGSATLITKNITENGTYNASSDQADGYSSVSVEVPSVQPTLITKNISENGTYNASSDEADGYSSVVVDVSKELEVVPNISSEYQEVEYVDIQNGSYLVDIPTEGLFTIDFSFDAITGEQIACGYRYGNYQNADNDFEIGRMSNKWIWQRDSSKRYLKEISIPSVSSDQAVIDTIYSVMVYFKDVRPNLYIGEYSENDGNFYPLNGKIYRVFAKNINTNEFLCYFKPCYKKSDGTIGLYECISGTFYGTLVRGSVTKGPDITSPSTPQHSFVEKTITANGTYNPLDDSAYGYDAVTVNVPAPPSRINDAKSLIPKNLINLSTKAYEKEETS